MFPPPCLSRPRQATACTAVAHTVPAPRTLTDVVRAAPPTPPATQTDSDPRRPFRVRPRRRFSRSSCPAVREHFVEQMEARRARPSNQTHSSCWTNSSSSTPGPASPEFLVCSPPLDHGPRSSILRPWLRLRHSKVVVILLFMCEEGEEVLIVVSGSGGSSSSCGKRRRGVDSNNSNNRGRGCDACLKMLLLSPWG